MAKFDKENKLKSYNIRLTEKEYEQLIRLRKQFNKPTSQLIRDSLNFYSTYYEDIMSTTEVL